MSDLVHHVLSTFAARSGLLQEETLERAILKHVGLEGLRAVSEVVATAGGVTWYVTHIPRARGDVWAVWDDSEGIDGLGGRVAYFETREEAVAFVWVVKRVDGED